MKIVILSQYYPPEVGAPQRRLSDLARRLTQADHAVTIVTAMPHYPGNRVHDRWRRRSVGRDQVDGIPVLRSWIWVPKSRSTIAQLASYGSFVVSALLTAPVRIRRADIVMWESPPIFLLPAAWVLARRLRARLVMNVADLWPRAAVEFGILKNPAMLRAFCRWERLAYSSADLITAQTPQLVDHIQSVVPGMRATIFPNGVDSSAFARVATEGEPLRDLHLPSDTFIVGYAGTIGRSHALEQLVEAAIRLQNISDLAVVCVGDGPRREKVESAARHARLKRMFFLPPVPAAEMPALLSTFDVAVVCQAKLSFLEGARSSKMFEVLATETPFVFCGDGEGAELARESGAALIVPPQDPDSLAAALLKFQAMTEAERRSMGKLGRAYVVSRFDRRRIAIELEKDLKQLTEYRQRP